MILPCYLMRQQLKKRMNVDRGLDRGHTTGTSPNGLLHLAIRPVDSEVTPDARLVLVHDMSFVERRSEETRRYLFYFFVALGACIALPSLASLVPSRVLAAEVLVAFRSRPDFRVVEIVGTPSIASRCPIRPGLRRGTGWSPANRS